MWLRPSFNSCLVWTLSPTSKIQYARDLLDGAISFFLCCIIYKFEQGSRLILLQFLWCPHPPFHFRFPNTARWHSFPCFWDSSQVPFAMMHVIRLDRCHGPLLLLKQPIDSGLDDSKGSPRFQSYFHISSLAFCTVWVRKFLCSDLKVTLMWVESCAAQFWELKCSSPTFTVLKG